MIEPEAIFKALAGGEMQEYELSLSDRLMYGVGVLEVTASGLKHVPLEDWYKLGEMATKIKELRAKKVNEPPRED